MFNIFTVAGHDFINEMATILPDENCTTIYTVEDTDYERSKVFRMTLRSALHRNETSVIRDPNAEENIAVNYTIILEDDDGEE